MAYTTKADVKSYIGVSSAVTSDDTLLTSTINRAAQVIDVYTGRHFEAQTATKYFDIDCVEGQDLILYGEDLLAITTLTNGDAVVLTSADYKLLPRNSTPKYVIRLDSDKAWNFTDADSEISVAGTWGWASTTPADIQHACIRLAAFLYRQKDNSNDVDRPLVTGDGVTIMPSQIPHDVQMLLNPYRRRIA